MLRNITSKKETFLVLRYETSLRKRKPHLVLRYETSLRKKKPFLVLRYETSLRKRKPFWFYTIVYGGLSSKLQNLLDSYISIKILNEVVWTLKVSTSKPKHFEDYYFTENIAWDMH
ncbi:hypothetical protein TNCV_4970941 [Trichonephila clavipes]|nr:hypothetical protein TNCV_4970941 [Trichonephila clavipes]